MRSKDVALLAKEACEDKKGEDIVILDIRKLSSISDYFVIVSGTSDRHVRAIAENVIDKMAEKKIKCTHVEGLAESLWALLDFGDVIVHAFHPETRRFYNLERLWGDAAEVKEPKVRDKIRKKKPARSSKKKS